MTETQAPYLAEKENRKDWKCQSCGVTLGYSFKHNGICRLSMPDRGVCATGRIDVECFGCGKIREWFADAEAIRRIVEMTGRKYNND